MKKIIETKEILKQIIKISEIIKKIKKDILNLVQGDQMKIIILKNII